MFSVEKRTKEESTLHSIVVKAKNVLQLKRGARAVPRDWPPTKKAKQNV